MIVHLIRTNIANSLLVSTVTEAQIDRMWVIHKAVRMRGVLVDIRVRAAAFLEHAAIELWCDAIDVTTRRDMCNATDLGRPLLIGADRVVTLILSQ